MPTRMTLSGVVGAGIWMNRSSAPAPPVLHELRVPEQVVDVLAAVLGVLEADQPLRGRVRPADVLVRVEDHDPVRQRLDGALVLLPRCSAASRAASRASRRSWWSR